MLRKPEDGLARAADRKRLDARREVPLGPRGGRPVALGQLIAAAAVEADRGQHGDPAAAAADVLVEDVQEALVAEGTSGSINTVASVASQSTEPTARGQSAGLPGGASGRHSGCGTLHRHRPGWISRSVVTRRRLVGGGRGIGAGLGGHRNM